MKRLSHLVQQKLESAHLCKTVKNSNDTAESSSIGTGTLIDPLESHIIGRKKRRHFVIAVTARSLTPLIKKIIDQMVKELEILAPGTFSCVLFDGQGSEQALFNYTVQIIQSYTMPYDAIVSVGALASQVATRASLLLNVRIPILFSSVQNPAHLGIIYPGERKESNVTGIAFGKERYQETIQTLQLLKGSVRKVLLPYNPTVAWLPRHAAEFSRLFYMQDIELLPLPVTSLDELKRQFSTHIHDVDTIMTMRDDIVSSNMSSIITTCNNYGITLYSADLETVEQGAAICFASNMGDDSAKEIAAYLIHLFKDDAAPHELPIKTMTTQWLIGINTDNAELQGVHYSKEEIVKIENKILFKKASETNKNQ